MGVDDNAHAKPMAHVLRMTRMTTVQTRLGFRTFIRTQEKNSGPHGDDFEPFVEMN